MRKHLSTAHLLAGLLFILLFSFSAKGQTFSYVTPICVNGPVQLPTLSPGFPTGGIFTSNPGGINIQLGSGMINPPMSQAGTYTITYINGMYGSIPCSCSPSLVVTIHNLTPASIFNTTVCASTTVAPLVLIAGPPGISYTWAPTAVTTQTLAVFPPYSGQNITLFITDGNGCTNQTSTQITTVQGPPVSISGNGTICPGSSVALTANGGGSNYIWNTGATGNVITVQPQVTTIYSVTATNNLGCSTTVGKTVTVNGVTLTVNSTTMCSGTTKTLTAASLPSNGVSYFWYPGPLTGQSVTVSPSSSQDYTVLGNRAGCTSSAIAKVSVSPSYSPVTVFNYKYPVCSNEASQTPSLSPNFYPGGSFSAIGPAVLDINDTTGVVNFENIVAGDYIVSYNTAAVGCTAATTGTALLSVGLSGKLDIIPDVILIKGSSATLSVSGGTYYNWSPLMDLDCANCDTPRVSPSESRQYCVTSDLCLDGGCVNVIVLCKNEGDLSVPNAFTPDGDGNNDKFCLQGWEDCLKKFEILVFDRWGTKVYESDKPSFCWDGTFNGQALNGGVYTYVITASFEIVPKVVKKGTITILR